MTTVSPTTLLTTLAPTTAPPFEAYKDFSCTALTGGSIGALDRIDGTNLKTGDMAKVVTASGVYWYCLNATSSATENSPLRINPDTNAGTKSWHLVGTTARIGAIVKLTSDQTLTTSTEADISWSSEVYDDASFWDSGDPTKLVVPIGVTKVIITANVGWDVKADSTLRRIRLFKNNSADAGYPFIAGPNNNNNEMVQNFTSSRLEASSGDYFELSAFHTVGSDHTVDGNGIRTWFSIEAVGFA